MIDKDLFPTEYAAIERLKENSRRIEREKDKGRREKQKKVDKWRRIFNEDNARRNG